MTLHPDDVQRWEAGTADAQRLNPAGAAAVPLPATYVPPPQLPPAPHVQDIGDPWFDLNEARKRAGLPPATDAPDEAALSLVDISRVYNVPLPMLLRASAADVGPPTHELTVEVDRLQVDAIEKVNAGARLVYALYHSGKDVILSLPDSTLRAYRAACEVYEVRPHLPGGE